GENGADPRTATITVTSGKTSGSVELTQRASTLIDVVGDGSFPDFGATHPFQIRTALSWTASITEGNAYCRLGSTTSGSGTGSVNVTFDANPGTESRNANLRVTASGEEINLALTQGQSSACPGGQNVPFRIELPEVKNPCWFIDHTYWAMEYDTAQRHSIWVAFVFNSYFNQKNVSRTDRWKHDPIVPVQYQWAFPVTTNSQRDTTIPTFTIAGTYDRGHIMASEDRVFNLLANWESFYITNISPQVSSFNQQIWASLEGLVRKWAGNCDTLYVVKGVAINKAGTTYTVNGVQQTFDGIDIIGTIPQRNNVTIGKWWYMALVKRTGNSFDGIAWWLENRPSRAGLPPGTNNDDHQTTVNRNNYSRYAITIRELEHRTGINFFPNLNAAYPPDPSREEAVETTFDIKKWESSW
ncbi:MAG: DNA/RNA non-specific endonuclease, partial [Bacteroidales bacterium]|nr:DNA/RNA non-specific endonuclease [Bacteroidales bacterium]